MLANNEKPTVYHDLRERKTDRLAEQANHTIRDTPAKLSVLVKAPFRASSAKITFERDMR